MKLLVPYFLLFFLASSFSVPVKAQGFAWARALQCDGIPMALATDASGNVYTTGQYSGVGDFDPGPGTFTLDASAASSIFISKLDVFSNFLWARSFVCTASGTLLCGSNTGISIKVGLSGDVYLTGYFSGIIDFDSGPGVFNLTSTGQTFDTFIVKLDANGNFIWAKMLDHTSTFWMDGGPFIGLDTPGNVYAIGHFSGTMDFDPGPGVFNMSSQGSETAYLLKLDVNGGFVWAKQFGSVVGWGLSSAKSIAVDPQGYIYASGGTYGPIDLDPGPGTYLTDSSSSKYISKLNSNGDLLWSKKAGGYVDIDALGNVYLTSDLFGTVDADPGPATYNCMSNGGSDVLIQKLDIAGNFLWARSFGGTNKDRSMDLSIDNTSAVYVIGDFEGTVDFDAGSGTYSIASSGGTDIYITRVEPNGNFGGVATFGSSMSDEFGFSIDCSLQGGVYSTGYFSNTVDFDHTAGTFMLTSTGASADIFIHKMDGLVGFAESRMDGISGFYPNPSNGQIRCQVQNNTTYRYEVSDPMGKVLQSGDLDYSSNEIDLGRLSKGLYFITLKGARQVYTQKIILQ
jgi:hypothetical protein